ncbi:MAG: hypothetical protein FJZ63_02790 [Chlamydiae bacterium]|nr:hypothetical protein [Chlamydiota bacterium]
MGIGALLLDGLGDTLRVSLTEDPWEEIDPCKKLVAYAQENRCSSPLYFSYEQLSSREVKVVPPLHREASVFAVVTEEEILQESFYEDIGLEFKEGKLTKTLKTVDMMLLEGECHSEKGLQKMISLQKAGVALGGDHSLSAYPIDSLEKVARGSPGFCIKLHENYTHLKMFKPSFILLEVPPFHVGRAREFFAFLAEEKFSYPVVVEVALDGDFDKELIRCSAEIGALLLDNLVQGLCIRGKPSLKERTRLAFNLLQGARKRSIKTEYIACPGCGRTLFGLQEVTKKIREKTGHLPGVKIAVMGCIVNGPGEMADADFGYVGSQSGKIDLYVGKTCVTKGILEEEAPERLIQLIKDKGLWIEPTCISSS